MDKDRNKDNFEMHFDRLKGLPNKKLWNAMNLQPSCNYYKFKKKIILYFNNQLRFINIYRRIHNTVDH